MLESKGVLKNVAFTAKYPSGRRTPKPRDASVLGNGRVNLVGPREDATFQVKDLAEAGFAQKVDGFGGALSAAAMSHDFLG